LNIKSANG